MNGIDGTYTERYCSQGRIDMKLGGLSSLLSSARLGRNSSHPYNVIASTTISLATFLFFTFLALT